MCHLGSPSFSTEKTSVFLEKGRSQVGAQVAPTFLLDQVTCIVNITSDIQGMIWGEPDLAAVYTVAIAILPVLWCFLTILLLRMINQLPVKVFDYEINLTIDSDLNFGLAMQYSTEGRDHSQTI